MEQRMELIVDLIKKSQAGLDQEQLKREAKVIFAHIRPEELHHAEEHLRGIGIDPQQMHSLRELQLNTLAEELTQIRKSVPQGHPVRVMIDEHDQILGTLAALEEVNERVQTAATLCTSNLDKLKVIANNLLAAEHHHEREEQVVFPELTKRNIGGTVQMMETEHNDLRLRKHGLKNLVEHAMDIDFNEFKHKLDELSNYIVYNLSDHIYKENHIMYPAALRLVKDEALWKDLQVQCDKIGYCDFQPV